MNKQIISSKAKVAFIASVACWLVYVLGCVLSSPSWSPDSSKVALLVTYPQDDPNQFRLFTYDLATGEHRLLDGVLGKGVLSAPAWSPDGRWIAYYRGDPAPADPNQTASAPFTEDTHLIPDLLFDVAKTHWEGHKPDETFVVDLVIVSPDGSQHKTLRTMQWSNSKDNLVGLMIMSPAWSKASGHLFYAQSVNDLFYIADIEIATGHTRACVLSSLGTLTLSPDGQWIATLLESGSWSLQLTKTDGTMQKSIQLDLGSDSSDSIGLTQGLSWSPDSVLILAASDKKVQIVNTLTGHTQVYQDNDVEEMAYGMFSTQGEVYYLAGLEKTDPNTETQPIELKSSNLKTGSVQSLLKVTDVPGVKDVGRLSVSPDARTVLIRCALTGESGKDRPALLFWDGKTPKVIETDPWMQKP